MGTMEPLKPTTLPANKSQEYRRLCQAWLKVVGRKKYFTRNRKSDQMYLAWCKRRSTEEFTELLGEDPTDDIGYKMVQNAISKKEGSVNKRWDALEQQMQLF